MSRRSRTTLLLVAIGALLLATLPAQADHSWSNYHWARTTPGFTLLHGDNVDDRWQSYFVEATGAAGYWTTDVTPTDGTDAEFIVLAATAGGTSPRQCRMTSGRVEVCNASYGGTGWLGVAGISVSGGHIQAGYVKLNDTYFDTDKYNHPVWRRLVMCQEIGHTLGLGHQDENFNNDPLNTCMDYDGSPVSADGDDLPNAHDYEQLATIYGGHVDGTNSYDIGTTSGGDDGGGSTKPGNGKGGGNKGGTGSTAVDASLWGREVASDGHTSTFVRQDGDTTLITHVVWAR